MKRAKWIVVSKFTTRKEFEEACKRSGGDPEDYEIEDFNEVEISVVREDDELGQKSYGWKSDGKIILFDEPDYPVSQKDMDWYQKAAEVVCNALNHGKL